MFEKVVNAILLITSVFMLLFFHVGIWLVFYFLSFVELQPALFLMLLFFWAV